MKETTDVYFMAFLISKGFKVEAHEVISRGKVKCKFNISSEDWNNLKLEFHNSDLMKFKHIIESLKDLAW